MLRASVTAVMLAFTIGFGIPIAMGPELVLAQDVPIVLPDAASFDVVSVKPSAPDTQFPGIRPIQPGGRFTAVGLTVRTLMQVAYGRNGALLETQIVSDAAWLDSERFDIAGTSERLTGPGDPFTAARGLLQSLLRERFGARVRLDTRTVPIYALVMSRGDRRLGPNLRPRQIPCPQQSAPSGSEQPCGFTRAQPGRWSAGGIEMALLATNVAHVPDVGRVVRDRTGLQGLFALDLTFTPQSVTAQGSTPSAPDIFTALPEQLGLKLESTRGPVEVVVVDHVERPTAD